MKLLERIGINMSKILLLLILGLLLAARHLAPATYHQPNVNKPVKTVGVAPAYVNKNPVYVNSLSTKPAVIVNKSAPDNPPLVQPTIPKPAVSSTPQNTNSAKCYTNCTDPNRPYFDQWGNEFDYMGSLIQVGNCTIQQPPINGPNPYCNQTNSSCAPTATVQDPCKLGQCFGYPYGICESNPNQGEMTK